MCIAGCMLCIQADQLHQMQDLVSSFPSGGVKFMDIQRLADDILDCHTGI